MPELSSPHFHHFSSPLYLDLDVENETSSFLDPISFSTLSPSLRPRARALVDRLSSFQGSKLRENSSIL